jgi:hypothetical protein
MATAEDQAQTTQESKLIGKGQRDEAHAREKSQPLLGEYQNKMNRDDTNRIAGMTNADIMQGNDATSTGQLLAAGKGQAQKATGLGQGLVDGGVNAAKASKQRQDSLKSNYNNLGNKKNMSTVSGMGTSAASAATVAKANADAKTLERQAMMDAAMSVGTAYGMKSWDTATDKAKSLNKVSDGGLRSAAYENMRKENKLGWFLHDKLGGL